MVKVDLPREGALQQLHERKRCRDDHLEDVVRCVRQQIPRRRLELQHPAEERSRREEQVGQVVASGIGAEKDEEPQMQVRRP